VLVRDDRVVGVGWHERAGGAHAEVVALADAGDRAAGATAYVTLEPCDHTGRTGPCSRALLDAGVTRVVVAREDPVAGHGGGLQRLAAAGVEVEVADLGGWEDALLHRWLRRQETGRPWVTLKLAVDAAGRTVPADGRWITGATARAAVHAQRARHDAVLVGVGTVIVDDPRLDVRDAPVLDQQPRPVVLDSTGRTPLDAVVVARGAVVVVTDRASADRRAALDAAGAEVVVVAARDGRVDPDAALAALAERGLHAVYAEPGSGLSSALVEAGVVDEFVVHRGGGHGDGWPRAWHRGRWQVVRARRLGADTELVARPA
jgi:diaminohydroxyphosphoribosylaminopyrimidine deaminase/5-amino-6-(5-phosphoribosylamino)uracil reductase